MLYRLHDQHGLRPHPWLLSVLRLSTVTNCKFLQDWLLLAYYRVRKVEYALLVATFVAIMILGLELGIFAGIVAASLIFAYQYSKVMVETHVASCADLQWQASCLTCMQQQQLFVHNSSMSAYPRITNLYPAGPNCR